jgi:uncharacterized protein YoxC
MEKLTQKELDERVAVLKKFRKLLEQQRNKFREYLEVLEKQQNSILNENADTLQAQTELEQDVVKSIVNLQKVIVPMATIYHSVMPEHSDSTTEMKDVPTIQSDLADLKQKVLVQNEKNRELLKSHISSIRTQLDSLKNPYRYKCSIYAEKKAVGNLIEIEV